jgi:hypothetical protein
MTISWNGMTKKVVEIAINIDEEGTHSLLNAPRQSTKHLGDILTRGYSCYPIQRFRNTAIHDVACTRPSARYQVVTELRHVSFRILCACVPSIVRPVRSILCFVSLSHK